ncbi:hypothetical protein QN382_19095 [Pseudomonas sp. 10B1]|uniref:hypothetical protein n=1 Tax=unclassified Pseudomonas TaxID=196821 RepID=UPI002AB34F2E|nr:MULTISPECIES: hypothetical protein [unclassified Pseudomonas]MDY7560187.1 hypothetical protein [Pseudomonas sp. AB6]MEA9994299.1 hypothetical protein [Pseudomonas sp. AA4]MEB0088524.1 hypothetical protein [Pseudomonas sp. RTI1]MEB0126553.1 hypothetical protein [Pseudomonas sp. CCC1.2]MEB0154634.1 hypothetical protein [Pseudomonas sp. CCC4.3]
MKASIPKSKRPVPSSPLRLYGSFNTGAQNKYGLDVVEEFLRRAELTVDPQQKLMQAQRVIGALMALHAFDAPKISDTELHRAVFARLSVLTGETPDALVIMAGVAI